MRNRFTVAVLVLCVGLLLPMMGYTQADPGSVSVIAKLKYDSLASYKGGVDGLDACSIAVTGGSRLDLSTPACLAYRAFLERKVEELEEALSERFPKARIVHRLLTVFGGVSVILDKGKVKDLLDLAHQEGAIGQARGRGQIQPASARHGDGAGLEPVLPALVGGDGCVLQLDDDAQVIGIRLRVARHGQ